MVKYQEDAVKDQIGSPGSGLEESMAAVGHCEDFEMTREGAQQGGMRVEGTLKLMQVREINVNFQKFV